MCDVIWLSRIEVEYKERLRALIIGKFFSKLFLNIVYPLNIFLLFIQLILNLLIYNNIFVSVLKIILLSIMFFNFLSFSIVIFTTFISFFIEGSKVFYTESLRKINKAKNTDVDIKELKQELKESKMIHGECVKSVVKKNIKTILILTCIGLIQCSIWMIF